MSAKPPARLLWDDNDAEARVVRGLSDDEVAAAVGRARARIDGAYCRLKTMKPHALFASCVPTSLQAWCFRCLIRAISASATLAGIDKYVENDGLAIH
jgi:hypothetical protein